jgi:hypothetical protein
LALADLQNFDMETTLSEKNKDVMGILHRMQRVEYQVQFRY